MTRSLHDFGLLSVSEMGFGSSDSWLPNKETTVALCTTVIAALVALYVYRTITQRSFQPRTRHIASEVDLVRLCEDIREEPLSSIDRSIRNVVNSDGHVPTAYTFYFKSDSVEKSAIVTASRFGRIDVVKYLTNNFSRYVQTSQTANLDLPVGRYHSMQEVHNCSALYAASFHGSMDIVSHLLKERAQINQRDCLLRTPLQVAAQRGHMVLVEYLLRKGADINAVDTHGYTPLLAAAGDRHTKVVQVLLENGADARHTALDGRTALHVAVEAGCKPVVSLLVKREPALARLRSYDAKHRLACPLHIAASLGHTGICELLMAESGCTPSQMPDVLLLWGAALVQPQHHYIRADVKKWWTEAMEVRQPRVNMTPSLAPSVEAYGYRSEVSTVGEVTALFPSRKRSPSPPSGCSTPQGTPTLSMRQLAAGLLNFTKPSLTVDPDTYIEICYQSLLIMERCLGYGDPLVIKKLMDVSKYLLGKHKYAESDQLLCRALEMSIDRVRRCQRPNHCLNTELEYEIKATLRGACDIISEMIAGGHDTMRFPVYLTYLETAFDVVGNHSRLDCNRNPAKINVHLVLFMLILMAAWAHHRNASYPASDATDASELSVDLTELDECETLCSRITQRHLFICNGTTLLHLVLSKLGTRDSLLPAYLFLKDLGFFVTSLLHWGADAVVNLPDEGGERPLHLAANRARTEQEAEQLISPLLKHDAHVDAVNGSGKTALEVQRFQVLQPKSALSLKCCCHQRIVMEGIDYNSLRLTSNFTLRDRQRLSLHDPRSARVEFEREFYVRMNS